MTDYTALRAMTDTYTVTQADRNAAAYFGLTNHMLSPRSYVDLRGGGEWDEWPLVQALAKHRTEAITTLQSQLAEAREALADIAGTGSPDFLSHSQKVARAALKDQSHAKMP
jgi:hypothetical protein